MKGYKFIVSDTDVSSYHVYAKLGARAGIEGRDPDQLRITPGHTGGWTVPEDHTLARLEDTGNAYIFYDEEGGRQVIDYCTMFYLRVLLEAQDRLRPKEIPCLEWSCEKIKVKA